MNRARGHPYPGAPGALTTDVDDNESSRWHHTVVSHTLKERECAST